MTRLTEDGFTITEAGFLYCELCGCLIMEGYRDVHVKACGASKADVKAPGP